MKPNHTQQMAKKNYTPENEAIMIATYDPQAAESVRDAQIDDLAEKLGKTRRSIIAKLSSMNNLYVPRDPANAKPSVKRGLSRTEIIRDCESALGTPKDALCSLARANKSDLLTLKAALEDIGDMLLALTQAVKVEKELDLNELKRLVS